jgi:hypothetical protein
MANIMPTAANAEMLNNIRPDLCLIANAPRI